jgi:enoyl-CoA hydratase/carnithine racemase
VFSLPETGLGLIPGGGGTQRLPRIIGLGRSLDLLITGERIDAARALEWGLVTRLLPTREALVAEASALAARIGARPPVATSAVKRAARTGVELELQAGLRLERRLFAELHDGEERRAAIAQFRGSTPARPARRPSRGSRCPRFHSRAMSSSWAPA